MCKQAESVPVIFEPLCTIRKVVFKTVAGFLFFMRVRKIAKSDCKLRHVRPSTRPHGTTWLPLEGFVLNLIFEYFSIICRENSSYVQLGEEWRVLYVKTNIQF